MHFDKLDSPIRCSPRLPNAIYSPKSPIVALMKNIFSNSATSMPEINTMPSITIKPRISNHYQHYITAITILLSFGLMIYILTMRS
jgi:hypothetical protein